MLAIHPLIQDFLLYVTVPVFTLFYWRGTWQLCTHYFYSGDEERSAWCSLLVGYGGMALFFLWQCIFHQSSLKQSCDINHMFNEKGFKLALLFMLTRLESYVVGFFVVNAWRGLWLLQNIYLLPDDAFVSSWLSHIIGTVALVLLLHLKSVYAPPVIFCRDDEQSITKLSLLSRMDDKEATGPDQNTLRETEESDTTSSPRNSSLVTPTAAGTEL